jgi:hypothetical protein|tara:strand:+ start:362 stop:613 length:252 start_codon:yes stop_codon:yes gene_type:complete
MTFVDIALIATFVMLVIAAIDAVRGKTALGKFRLSKQDEDPSRFWFAIVLYINMAFGMFWLAGMVGSAEPEEQPTVTVNIPPK